MSAETVNSSTRSWADVVRQADPDFERESKQPVVYEFARRKFRQKINPYETTAGDHHSPGYPGT